MQREGVRRERKREREGVRRERGRERERERERYEPYLPWIPIKFPH